MRQKEAQPAYFVFIGLPQRRQRVFDLLNSLWIDRLDVMWVEVPWAKGNKKRWIYSCVWMCRGRESHIHLRHAKPNHTTNTQTNTTDAEKRHDLRVQIVRRLTSNVPAPMQPINEKLWLCKERRFACQTPAMQVASIVVDDTQSLHVAFFEAIKENLCCVCWGLMWLQEVETADYFVLARQDHIWKWVLLRSKPCFPFASASDF